MRASGECMQQHMDAAADVVPDGAHAVQACERALERGCRGFDDDVGGRVSERTREDTVTCRRARPDTARHCEAGRPQLLWVLLEAAACEDGATEPKKAEDLYAHIMQQVNLYFWYIQLSCRA